MTRCLPALIPCLLLAACAAAPPAGAPRTDCAPLPVPSANLDTPRPGDPATPAPVPFSYTIGPAPAEAGEYASATVDGRESRFQAGVVLVSFDASPVPSTGPEGIIPGVLAHQALIEPVLRDFGLEVIEQSRNPTQLVPIRTDETPPPPPATREWSVRPEFRTRIRDLAAVPLDALQADATAAGLTGTWIFAGHDAAAVWAKVLRIQRTGGCYPQLRGAFPNVMMSPG